MKYIYESHNYQLEYLHDIGDCYTYKILKCFRSDTMWKPGQIHTLEMRPPIDHEGDNDVRYSETKIYEPDDVFYLYSKLSDEDKIKFLKTLYNDLEV